MARLCVLFKSSEDSNSYATACANASWTPIFVPVLEITQLNPLPDILEQADRISVNYDGIILTSQHAAKAFVSCLRSTSIKFPSNFYVFVVGAKVKDVLMKEQRSDLNIFGEQSGSASKLVEFITSFSIGKGISKLLFLCGSNRLDTISESFKGSSIEIVEEIVYKSVSASPEKVKDDFYAALGNYVKISPLEKLALVFFSPSGVETLMADPDIELWMSKSTVVPSQSIFCDFPRPFLVSIGNTTASAMICTGLQPHQVCQTPDAIGLHQALSDLNA
jgi:uroporphyrinogen-III synthase